MKDLSRANEAADKIGQLFKLQNEWRAQAMRQMNDLMTVIIAQRELLNKLARHQQAEDSESLIQLAQKVSVMTEDTTDELRDEALDVLLQMSILRRE